MKDRLARERETLRAMVALHCHDRHRPKEGLCPDCGELLNYAEARLSACPFGSEKPTCARCPIHCYKPLLRERAREVMRFAGPRMLLYHPWLALLHLLDGFRKVTPCIGKGNR